MLQRWQHPQRGEGHGFGDQLVQPWGTAAIVLPGQYQRPRRDLVQPRRHLRLCVDIEDVQEHRRVGTDHLRHTSLDHLGVLGDKTIGEPAVGQCTQHVRNPTLPHRCDHRFDVGAILFRSEGSGRQQPQRQHPVGKCPRVGRPDHPPQRVTSDMGGFHPGLLPYVFEVGDQRIEPEASLRLRRGAVPAQVVGDNGEVRLQQRQGRRPGRPRRPDAVNEDQRRPFTGNRKITGNRLGHGGLGSELFCE